MDKRSFLLYKDIKVVLDHLTDKEAGQLFKLIVSYVNCEKPDITNHPLRLLFLPIKQQLKRDLLRYQEKCDKNKENAHKRWDNATAYDRIRPHAKHADTDTDTGNGIDTDNENDIHKPTLDNFVTKGEAEDIIIDIKETLDDFGLEIFNKIKFYNAEDWKRDIKLVRKRIKEMVTEHTKKKKDALPKQYRDGEGILRDLKTNKEIKEVKDEG